MRWLVLVALLAGCDAEGITNEELPPSAPPPVEIAPGTLVQQTWQVANHCAFMATIAITSDGNSIAIGTADAGHTSYFPTRCAVGDEVCFAAGSSADDRVLAGECGPCAPGVRAPTILRCN